MTKSIEKKTPVKKNKNLPYYERYLMTVDEAAAYFHLGSRKMYEVIHNNEGAKWYLYNGKRLMIKRDMFAKWLDQQTTISIFLKKCRRGRQFICRPQMKMSENLTENVDIYD